MEKKEIKKVLDGAEFVMKDMPEELKEVLKTQIVNPKLMDEFDNLYDEDIDAETVKALSHALELDYIEKWKVFAQMKLLEKNFAIAEQARVALREQLTTANANVSLNAAIKPNAIIPGKRACPFVSLTYSTSAAAPPLFTINLANSGVCLATSRMQVDAFFCT